MNKRQNDYSNWGPSIKMVMELLGAKEEGNKSLCLISTRSKYKVREFINKIYGEGFIRVVSRSNDETDNDDDIHEILKAKKSIDNKYSVMAKHETNKGCNGVYEQNYKRLLDPEDGLTQSIRVNAKSLLNELPEEYSVIQKIEKGFLKWFNDYNKTHALLTNNWDINNALDGLSVLLIASVITDSSESYKKLFSRDVLSRLAPSIQLSELPKDDQRSLEELKLNQALRDYCMAYKDILTETDFTSFVRPIPNNIYFPSDHSDRIVLLGNSGTGKTYFLLYFFLIALRSLGIDMLPSINHSETIEGMFHDVDFHRLPIYFDIKRLPQAYLSQQSLLRTFSLRDFIENTVTMPSQLIDNLLKAYKSKYLILIDNAELLQNIDFMLADTELSSASIIITGKGFHISTEQTLFYNLGFRRYYLVYNKSIHEKSNILSSLSCYPKYQRIIQSYLPHNSPALTVNQIITRAFFSSIDNKYKIGYESLYYVFGHLFMEESIYRESIHKTLLKCYLNDPNYKSKTMQRISNMFYDVELAKSFIDYSNLFSIPSIRDGGGTDYVYAPSNFIIASCITAQCIIRTVKARDLSEHSDFSSLLFELSRIKKDSLRLYTLFFLISFIDVEDIDYSILADYLSVSFSRYIAFPEIWRDYDECSLLQVIIDIFDTLRKRKRKHVFNEDDLAYINHAFTSFLPDSVKRELITFNQIPNTHIDGLFADSMFRSFLSTRDKKLLVIRFSEKDKTVFYNSLQIQYRLYLFYISLCIMESDGIQIMCQKKDHGYLLYYFPTLSWISESIIEFDNIKCTDSSNQLTGELTINIPSK